MNCTYSDGICYLGTTGKLLSKFSINPRFAKMLVVSYRSGVLPLALTFVAILSEKSPYEVGEDAE